MCENDASSRVAAPLEHIFTSNARESGQIDHVPAENRRVHGMYISLQSSKCLYEFRKHSAKPVRDSF